MGKSTTAAMFSALNTPVWDADAAVHRIYGPGGAAVGPVGAEFPQCVTSSGIDRVALSQAVLHDRAKLAQLEAIVHPLVGEDRAAFIAGAKAANANVVVLDIPLLFETGGHKAVDAIIVVSCAPDVQRARVLGRPGMSEEKFQAILARQVPDEQKRAMADFVVDTGHGLDHARQQVETILTSLRQRALQMDQSSHA
jgi:dephospho-CoA kinase